MLKKTGNRFIVLSNLYRKQKQLTYPINTMRNVGRVPATSHYIFPSDLELYPSPGLIPQFLKMVSEGIFSCINDITLYFQSVVD